MARERAGGGPLAAPAGSTAASGERCGITRSDMNPSSSASASASGSAPVAARSSANGTVSGTRERSSASAEPSSPSGSGASSAPRGPKCSACSVSGCSASSAVRLSRQSTEWRKNVQRAMSVICSIAIRSPPASSFTRVCAKSGIQRGRRCARSLSPT